MQNNLTELAPAMFDLLCRNWQAWDGEEESVKEEHADLIEETDEMIERVKAGGAVAPVEDKALAALRLALPALLAAYGEPSESGAPLESVQGREAILAARKAVRS